MFRGTTVFVPAGLRSNGRRPDDGAGFEALLLAAPPELSAEDLASGLQASRRPTSQATRMLIQEGPIERRRRRKERSDNFRVKPSPRNAMVRQWAIHGVLTPLDPSPDAMSCNSEQSRE
jgi:hypothetical protein